LIQLRALPRWKAVWRRCSMSKT